MFPRCSTIGAAIETASRAAAVHAPGRAPRLPQRGKNHVRIIGIEREINAAGVFVLVENFAPGLTAVSGAEDAAFGVGAIGVAESRDVGDVWIFGMYGNAANGTRIAEANRGPGLASVDGFVNAVAVDDVAANAGFAGAGIDH